MSDAEAEITPSTPAVSDNDAPTGAAAAPVVSFGALLSAAREAQGLSQADMAGRLRLHPRQVAALEGEHLEQLPSAPFIRGYVRNYAKELKLDPAPILAALAKRLPATTAADEQAPLAGVSAAEVRSAGVEHASRLAVVGGTVAVLVVLGLIGWIASERLSPAPAVPPTAGSALAPSAAPLTVGENGAPAPAATSDVRPEAAGTTPAGDAAATGSASALPPAVDSRSTSGAALPAAVDATPQAGSSAAASPAPASSAPFVAGLRIVVGDRPSWVEVTSADGRVALTGLQEAGTERRIGNLQSPVRLVIGNASTVSLEYRGKPVDLKPAIRANDLARLTLE